MKLLTYLSIFSMTLLSLQPIAQAKNPPGLTDRRSASRTALQRATRSIPPPLNTTGGLRVEYTLVTANSPDCDPSLIDNFPVRLQYRLIRPQAAENDSYEWMASPQCTPSLVPDCENNLTSQAGNASIHVTVRSYRLLIPSDIDHINSSQRIQLRFVQSDHRGGFCDCWAVSNLSLTFVESSTVTAVPLNTVCGRNVGAEEFNSLSTFLQNFEIIQNNVITCTTNTSPPISPATSVVGFCRGSASAPRGFVSAELGAETEPQCENTAAVVDTGRDAPLIMGDQCESMPHVNIRFSLLLGGQDLNYGLNSFEEGLEVAFRNMNSSNREWIPLKFYTANNSRNNAISVGNIDSDSGQLQVNIRGFDVPYVIGLNDATRAHEANLTICGSEVAQRGETFNHIQFRWLQTVQQGKGPDRDRILLDNVTITSSVYSTKLHKVLVDDFDNQTRINASRWTDVRHASLQCDNEQRKCLQVQFGKESPTFSPLNGHRSTIISRGLSTVPLDPTPPSPQLSYTLITASSPDCLSSYPAYVASAPMLEYRQGNEEWKTVNYRDQYTASDDNSTTMFVADLGDNSDYFQFRFVQLEHRGGFCDCWAIADLAITYQGYTNTVNETCDDTGKYIHNNIMENVTSNYDAFRDSRGEMQERVVAEFCGGSASVERGFVTHKMYLNPQSTGGLPFCDNESVVVDRKEDPSTQCNDTELRIEITFDLDFLTGSGSCDSIDSFHEGVELSFRNLVKSEEDMTQSDEEWVPLIYFTSNLNLTAGNLISLVENNTLSNETRGNFMLRGYSVPYVITSKGSHRVTLCSSEADLLDYPLELRWLQTSSISNRSTAEDIIMLDNISIRLQNASHFASLFDEEVNDQNSLPDSDLLIRDNVWLSNTDSTNICKPIEHGGALFFYTLPITTTSGSAADTRPPAVISSRRLVIGPLDPRNVTLELRPPAITTPPPISPTPSEAESETLARIISDPRISRILTLIEGSPQLALEELASVLGEPVGDGGLTDSNSTGAGEVDLSAAAYLLSRVGSVLGNESVEPAISEAFVSVGDSLLDAAQRRTVMAGTDTPAGDTAAGSTLLQVLERFALNNHDVSHQPPRSDNIVFQVQKLLTTEPRESITPIQENIAKINIPSEVFASQEDVNQIKVASFLFRNMSGLLPQRIANSGSENDSDSDNVVFRLASPVISASFQCDTCTTSNLSTPVQVTFKHTSYDAVLLENDSNDSEVKCVFWDFNDVQRADAILFEGQWSEEGCQVNKDLSTFFMTVCECNHLTNFAILLSARPPTFTPPQALTLQIVGNIGVSVSLVAMAATVFVFLFQKALRTMRNYIHIQLCVTLGIAQIIFVAGIEPHLGEGHLVGGVPVGCRLVAVLLHYWFLVSFMWMLMEGVVLYVALVRVFVKYHARYIAAFTIASYGLPLLYVGVLTVPLGFARSEEMRTYQEYDYGYQQACYFNPSTSFVWSFIAPVILIILANIGFFVMAVVIMARHQKRQHDKNKAKQVRHWLKAVISLTVVMGITWIIGVLVVEVEQLFALAFIFTIFVAFQGLFIFVIFVLLSRQVKESYAKWWKAKVAESDFLSKHFGEKSLTPSTLTTRRTAPTISFGKSSTAQETSVAAGEKLEFSRSHESIIKASYVEEGPAAVGDKEEEKPPQDFGTFFNVIFVARPDSVASWNTMTNADIENGYLKEGSSRDNLVETELNGNRAVPNHYVDSSEFLS